MDSYLDDVPPENVFVIGEKRLRNLVDLLFELKNISDDNYSHYASPSHNYFSDWIENIIKDKALSNLLRSANSRREAIEILLKRIEDLNKEIESEKEPVKEVMQENLTEEKNQDKSSEETKKTVPMLKSSSEVLELDAPKIEAEQDLPVLAKFENPKKELKEAKKEIEKESREKEEAKEVHKEITGKYEAQQKERETSKSSLGISAENEKELKDFLWKHFAWDMAKEFMYGMAIGILIGFVFARIFTITG